MTMGRQSLAAVGSRSVGLQVLSAATMALQATRCGGHVTNACTLPHSTVPATVVQVLALLVRLPHQLRGASALTTRRLQQAMAVVGQLV